MRKTSKTQLKQGQPVNCGGQVCIYQHYMDSENSWCVRYFDEDEPHFVTKEPIALTEDDFLLYCSDALGWKLYPLSLEKHDGDTKFCIEKYRGKWVLRQEGFVHGEECGDGYWETEDEISSTIQFLKECRVIVSCLNSIN